MLTYSPLTLSSHAESLAAGEAAAVQEQHTEGGDLAGGVCGAHEEGPDRDLLPRWREPRGDGEEPTA